MGLDMYMKRTKKIDGMTLEQIMETARYVDYLARPKEYADCSPREWNGCDESEVLMDKVDDVKANFHTCYPAWDTEKKYGHEDVFDGVAYWRKANAIHNWFVVNCADGVDDCKPIEITKEMLEDLLYAAKLVKDNSELIDGTVNNGFRIENGKEIPITEDGKVIKDPSVAMEVLPVKSGFFFGGTDYDQWYMEDIESTIEQITKIFETTNFDKEYVIYEASW